MPCITPPSGAGGYRPLTGEDFSNSLLLLVSTVIKKVTKPTKGQTHSLGQLSSLSLGRGLWRLPGLRELMRRTMKANYSLLFD